MYVYSSRVTWTEGRRGRVVCGNGFKSGFSPPPEFHGEPGTLTPEDALVAAVGMSFTVAFLRFAEKEKVALRAFECSCNGIMDRTMPRLAFKRVVIHPRAVVASDEDVPKVERCMEMAEKNCPVVNSLRPKVVVEYKVELERK
ncbi:MAG: OsmC family protein [Thermoplasmatota archaeon]